MTFRNLTLRKSLLSTAIASLVIALGTMTAAPVMAEHHEHHADMDKAAPSIVGIASTNADFETLTAALTAADLVSTLEGKGPFTVFAPTDAAFAKLPAGTLENLLKPENKAKLAGILTYHVVSGKVMAADVVKLTSAKTVNGKAVKITVTDGKVMVDGANVTTTDIKASNGVIHIIDSVILP
jgi:uncharacterized surface protein with fasciclin (FAS1) repeats